jgi:hypothetical protein
LLRSDIALKFADFLVNPSLNAHVLRNGRRESHQLRYLMLRQQIYLQVEVGSFFGCACHAVLTNQNERREEDGFN